MIGLSVTMEGTEQFRAVLGQLSQLETRFAGVELIGARQDGVDSDVIVESLQDKGRDFFSADTKLANDVADAFGKEIERRMDAAIAAARPSPNDDVLAASGLMAAMRAYMDGVVKRIDAQVTANGSAPSPLTPQYAAAKQRKYGFSVPIGKASGQLIHALTAGGAAAGKIRLVRR